MLVNELAKKVGVPAHVVRFYTHAGLLKPRRDPKNHYRKYAESDTSRLRFIRRAKCLGFTLADVKAILSDADQGISPCAEVRRIIRIRAGEIHDHLEELKHLQSLMEEAVTLWDSMPDQAPDHESLCHLIDAMAKSERDLT